MSLIVSLSLLISSVPDLLADRIRRSCFDLQAWQPNSNSPAIVDQTDTPDTVPVHTLDILPNSSSVVLLNIQRVIPTNIDPARPNSPANADPRSPAVRWPMISAHQTDTAGRYSVTLSHCFHVHDLSLCSLISSVAALPLDRPTAWPVSIWSAVDQLTTTITAQQLIRQIRHKHRPRLITEFRRHNSPNISRPVSPLFNALIVRTVNAPSSTVVGVTNDSPNLRVIRSHDISLSLRSAQQPTPNTIHNTGQQSRTKQTTDHRSTRDHRPQNQTRRDRSNSHSCCLFLVCLLILYRVGVRCEALSVACQGTPPGIVNMYDPRCPLSTHATRGLPSHARPLYDITFCWGVWFCCSWG